MRLRYYILTLLVECLPLGAHAQGPLSEAAGRQRHAATASDSLSPWVRAYVDSLLWRHSQPADSTSQASPKNPQARRLFLPLTFYRAVAAQQFSLSDTISPTDRATHRALLNVYLHRPDLVRGTQSQLDIVGSSLSSPTPVRDMPTNIVEKVAPNPVEPHQTQVNVLVRRPNFWKFSGEAGFQMYQNYISGNWYKGGESNYSLLSKITLRANYNNKQKVKWENTLEMKIGMLNSRSDTLHTLKTNEDLLRYTSNLGLQASKRWYYTIKLEAQTQFLRAYRSNDPKVYSDFTSPLKANVSIGMDYNLSWLKNRLTGSIHLAPLSYDFKYVDRRALLSANGIPASRHTNDDFGSLFTADLNWKLANTINWKIRMKGYTSFHRVEYEWENTFDLKVTKYITSNLFIYPRFDDSRKRDDHHGYWMFKEYLSLGLSYSF